MKSEIKAKRPTRYWLIVLGLALIIVFIIFGSFAGSWFFLSDQEKILAKDLFLKLIPFPLVGSITLILFISPIVNFLFEYYINPIRKIAEEAKLISSVNPSHRIDSSGSDEIMQLVKVINEAAEQSMASKTDVQLLISETKAELEKENLIQKELLDKMPCGLISCDLHGNISYFNANAKHLFHYEYDESIQEESLENVIGIGRSIFKVIDRKYIALSLDYLKKCILQGYSFPVANFLLNFKGDPFLRVNMSPLQHSEEDPQKITGFLLSFEEILHQVEAESKREVMKQALRNSLQPSLTNIMTSLANIMNDGEMDIDNLEEQRKSIDQSSATILDQLELFNLPGSERLNKDQKKQGVSSNEFFDALKDTMEQHHEIEITIKADQVLDLNIDHSYLVKGLVYFLSQLVNKLSVGQVQFHLQKASNMAELILDWQAPPLRAERLKEWFEKKLFVEEGHGKISLKTLVDQIGCDLWDHFEAKGSTSKIQISIPLVPQESDWSVNFIQGHRPVYTDFDIFSHDRTKPEAEETDLKDLAYVVFDTETTGLDPSGGDEIISIGAVRIYNDHLLHDETIDQLINPKRPIPPSSIKIHGIKPEELKNQPTIEQVLPIFYKYAEDSVLIAHNAAFDMRFLQLKEKKTGIRFTQPILDTLLLSAIIHPNQELHNLEDIAQRLGVTISGRHTALGDAIVTGKIFLKMIPLLKEKGIVTLHDAKKASMKTEYSKLKF